MNNPLDDGSTINLFLDTEFHDRYELGRGALTVAQSGVRGSTGVELISIALYEPLSSKIFYRVSNEFDVQAAGKNRFLWTEVLPGILNQKQFIDTNYNICLALSKWINEDVLQGKKDKNFRIWTWYGAYDMTLLCQLMGGFDFWPDHWPMFTHDLRAFVEVLGNDFDANNAYKPPTAMQSQLKGLREHHALYDAVQLYCKWVDFWGWVKEKR